LKEITVDQKSEIFDKNVSNNSLEVEKHAIKNSPLFTVILEPKFTDDSQRHLSPQLVTKAGDSRISELKESHDMKVKPIQENITEKTKFTAIFTRKILNFWPEQGIIFINMVIYMTGCLNN